jgi:hypothetical protein
MIEDYISSGDERKDNEDTTNTRVKKEKKHPKGPTRRAGEAHRHTPLDERLSAFDNVIKDLGSLGEEPGRAPGTTKMGGEEPENTYGSFIVDLNSTGSGKISDKKKYELYKDIKTMLWSQFSIIMHLYLVEKNEKRMEQEK